MADDKLVAKARLMAILSVIFEDDRMVEAFDEVAPEGFLNEVLIKSEQVCQEVIDSGKSKEMFQQYLGVWIDMLQQDLKTLEEV